MIEINLLPKEYRKRKFDFSIGKTGVYAVGAAAAIVVMLIGITFFQKWQMSEIDADIQKARQRAQMLAKDIKVVDALTDVKVKIQRRMSAVERLDSHRSSWVKLLEEMALTVPDYVWVGNFHEKPLVAQAAPKPQNAKPNPGQVVTETPAKPAPVKNQPMVREAEVEGYAFTLNSLASYMINMMRSDYFDKVELVSTKEVTLQKKKAFSFVLSFDVHYLSDEELQEKIAKKEDITTEDITKEDKTKEDKTKEDKTQIAVADSKSLN